MRMSDLILSLNFIITGIVGKNTIDTKNIYNATTTYKCTHYLVM